MSQYQAIKAATNAYIKTNGRREITGAILNAIMISTIDSLGRFYQFVGYATPDTDPGVIDQNIAYLAGTPGEYTHLGGFSVAQGEIAVIKFDGTWKKEIVIVIPTKLSELTNDLGFITMEVSDLVHYYTKDYLDGKFDDIFTKEDIGIILAGYYGKDEVDALVAAISRQSYVEAWDGASEPIVTQIPEIVSVIYSGVSYTGTLEASESTLGKIYLVSNGAGYDMYATSDDGNGTYHWITIGSTTLDLSGYATQAEVDQIQAEITMQSTIVITPTIVESLRVATTISSNTSDRLYYIPVTNGMVFHLKYVVGSGYVRTGYCTSVPASGVATSNRQSYTASGNPQDKELTSPVDGYFVVSVLKTEVTSMSFETGSPDGIGKSVVQLQDRMTILEEDMTTLDGKVGGIDTELTIVEKDLYSIPYSFFEMGSFNSSGQPNTGSTNRCRTNEFIPVKAGQRLKVGFGEYEIFFYSSNQSFIEHTSWAGVGEYIFASDALIKILCRVSSDNETFDTSDANYESITRNILIIADNLSGMGDRSASQAVDYEYGNLTSAGNIAPSTLAYFNTFFTSFRTSKFLDVADLTLVYSGCTPEIYQYTRDFGFIGKVAYSGKYVNDNPKVGYIKVSGTIDDADTFSIEFRSTGDIRQVFNQRMDGDAHTFLYRAFPSQGRSILNADGTESEYTATKYADSGFLRLPPNYSPTGTPVKLLLWCQSSGEYGSMTAQSLSGDYEAYYDYLAKEGFAIMSAYGWTTKFADPNADNKAGHLPPTPTTMASIRNAYEWVCRNFNIDKSGIYISGKSFGGCFGAAMMFQTAIPVKAIGLLAPLLTIREPGAGLGYSRYDRIAYCEDSCFVDYEDAFLENPTSAQMQAIMVRNARLFLGYDATLTNMRNIEPEDIAGIMNTNAVYDTIKRDGNNVALKIWVAKDDTQIGFNPCKYHIDSIVNGGGNAEIREMPAGTGGHHAVDNAPNALKVASLRTRLGYVCTNIPLAYAEMVDFFNQY